MNIRVKEAATHLGLSKSTLDKLRHFGGGPRYFKLGRSVVYDVADLDAWRNERAAISTWHAANSNIPGTGARAAWPALSPARGPNSITWRA